MTRPKLAPVVITGAAGVMGEHVRRHLSDVGMAIRSLSREPLADLGDTEVNLVGDLTDAAYVHESLSGAACVLHFAGIADEAPFSRLLQDNILATHTVYAASLAAGVRRVVFASTNHVVGFYPVTAQPSISDPPRPDTHYAATKVFGEALARLYHDKWGVESICLRIGSFRPEPTDQRQLSTWLSPRDTNHLVDCCLTDIPVGYAVVFGVSANTRGYWRPGDDAARIGYRPLDDAEHYAVRMATGSPDRSGSRTVQGGVFADPDYQGGHWTPAAEKGALR